MRDTALLLKAAAFSASKHRAQRRKGVDASPYINHPVEVANLLANVAGIADLTTLVAAILHDTLEDTDASPEEIERLFGHTVLALVRDVTDDTGLPRTERKRLQVEGAPHLSTAAKLIRIADKISNVRDVTQNPPETWSLERRREYLDFAERVVECCRGTNDLLEREFDEAIRAGRKALSVRGPSKEPTSSTSGRGT